MYTPTAFFASFVLHFCFFSCFLHFCFFFHFYFFFCLNFEVDDAKKGMGVYVRNYVLNHIQSEHAKVRNLNSNETFETVDGHGTNRYSISSVDLERPKSASSPEVEGDSDRVRKNYSFYSYFFRKF